MSTSENETRELRKQVDSLVELLGHHGVRLESKAINQDPPRPAAPQLTSTWAPPTSARQAVADQEYLPPPLPMPLPQLGYIDNSGQDTLSNQNRPIEQPFNDSTWSNSPVEHLPDGTLKQSIVSPPTEPSHGTLVISASGRSKYLGPSAASEWLKDVSFNILDLRLG